MGKFFSNIENIPTDLELAIQAPLDILKTETSATAWRNSFIAIQQFMAFARPALSEGYLQINKFTSAKRGTSMEQAQLVDEICVCLWRTKGVSTFRGVSYNTESKR